MPLEPPLVRCVEAPPGEARVPETLIVGTDIQLMT